MHYHLLKKIKYSILKYMAYSIKNGVWFAYKYEDTNVRVFSSYDLQLFNGIKTIKSFFKAF